MSFFIWWLIAPCETMDIWSSCFFWFFAREYCFWKPALANNPIMPSWFCPSIGCSGDRSSFLSWFKVFFFIWMLFNCYYSSMPNDWLCFNWLRICWPYLPWSKSCMFICLRWPGPCKRMFFCILGMSDSMLSSLSSISSASFLLRVTLAFDSATFAWLYLLSTVFWSPASTSC